MATKTRTRTEFRPAKLVGAQKIADLISYNGSAHLLSLLNSDGFVILPDGGSADATRTSRTKTASFNFLPLDNWLRCNVR